MWKPKDCLLNDTTWNALPWHSKLDMWVSSWIPGWIISLIVSLVFSLVITAVIMAVFALAYLDPTWFWSVTSRAMFGVWTLVLFLILRSQS